MPSNFHRKNQVSKLAIPRIYFSNNCHSNIYYAYSPKTIAQLLEEQPMILEFFARIQNFLVELKNVSVFAAKHKFYTCASAISQFSADFPIHS